MRDRGPDRTRPTTRATSVIGLLVFLAGLVDLVSAGTPAYRSRLLVLRHFVPGVLSHSSGALTIVSGVLLVLIAKALRRRKRRAWRLAVVLLSFSVILHLLKGLDVEEATASGVLLGVLVWRREEFYAIGDPRTRWRAVGASAVLLSSSVLLGTGLIYLRGHTLVASPSLGSAMATALRGLLGFSGPLQWQSTALGRSDGDFVRDTLFALGMVTLVATTYLTLRPSEPIALLSDADERRIRTLLVQQGRRDSLGYFALRRDKSVIWGPSGKACVSYRVLSGVMLASGDPVGDPDAWPAVIEAFLVEAQRHAWTPAALSCSLAGGRAWSRAGLTALELGDEAIVETECFSMHGREMRNVRQAVARAQRANYEVVISRLGDLSVEDRARLRDRATLWRGASTERGFSMALSRLGGPDDDQCVAVTASCNGQLRAFLHLVPWGPDGLSLDLMRRDRDAVNGVNEFMISRLLETAPGLGITRVSLNFAVFRSTFERSERLGAGPVLMLTRRILLFGSRWWQLESLYRFNEKFQPDWQPRFVCFPQARDLPRVALASAEAEAFLTWPRLRRVSQRVQRRGRSTEPPSA